MVALKNANKRRGVGPYNLPAAQIGNAACESVDMQSTEHNPETGERGVRQFTKLISPSLRFEAGELKTGLPDAVLQCPDIIAAISSGELRKV